MPATAAGSGRQRQPRTSRGRRAAKSRNSAPGVGATGEKIWS